jgi:hypothetical protein
VANPFQPLVETLSTLEDMRADTFDELQSIEGPGGQKIDLSTEIPGTAHSITEINLRVGSLLQMASCMTSEQDPSLVPQARINEFKAPVDQMLSQYLTINETLARIKSEGGGVGIIDPASSSLQSQQGEIKLELATHFTHIWNHSEAALGALYPLLGILRAQGFGDFSSAHAAFSAIVQEVQKERRKFADLVKEGQKARDELKARGQKLNEELETLKENAVSVNEEISRLRSESENYRKSLSEYASEGTDKITSIRATNADAEELEKAVETYQAQFTNFQNQLDRREKIIERGNLRQQELVESLNAVEKEINEINDHSRTMLSGATIAGLAGEFGNIRNSLSDELKKARRVFYLSIGLLFLSLIPLILYVFPGVFARLGVPTSITTAHGTETMSALEFLGQIAARAILLIPAAWFTKFAAARHAALFRLKEHYAYKYSVAASVDGFKQQADPYKNEIAAATFFELTFNPADRMEGKGGEERHPNPAMEFVMKKLGMTEDGRS